LQKFYDFVHKRQAGAELWQAQTKLGLAKPPLPGKKLGWAGFNFLKIEVVGVAGSNEKMKIRLTQPQVELG
jgi:hypothetical protein